MHELTLAAAAELLDLAQDLRGVEHEVGPRLQARGHYPRVLLAGRRARGGQGLAPRLAQDVREEDHLVAHVATLVAFGP